MRRKVPLFMLAFLVLTSFHSGDPGLPNDDIVQIFNKADSLLNLTRPTRSSDRQALEGFELLIERIKNDPSSEHDSILFLCYLKKGILMDIRTDYKEATTAYQLALQHRNYSNRQFDSLGFMTYVNAGASYYNLNNFDSANYFLLKAESQINKFSAAEDKMRLYNTLGVLYHDNGNYLQSKNYFDQAEEILRSQGTVKSVSIVSLESNVATAFFKLGQFSEALAIYKKILRYHVFSDYIYLNMGRAYAGLKQFQEALYCYRRVDGSRMPWVYNEAGYAQLQVGRLDSSAYFLDHWQKLAESGRMNKIDLAINGFYRASLLAEQKQWKQSLENLQQAIILFAGNFRNENIFQNPDQFTGTFAYYRLFDAMSEKASIFEKWYKAEGKVEFLEGAFAAYSSTLALLSYIEKSYDTDDAKMLLKKKSRHIYQEALTVCLQLHRLYPKAGYLEKAFLITEENKASIVVASLKEKNMHDLTGPDEELVQKERNIKYNIARLNIESDQARDNATIELIASEKSKYEIELTRVQKALEKNSMYYRIKYDESYPRISELQNRLTKKQAMISFYTSDNAIHLFIVTSSSFDYSRIDSLSMLQADFADWIRCLKSTENGRRFGGENTGRRIVDRLIRPIQAMIPDQDEWIIIPDGLLYFLPFESLPAGKNGEPLIETTTVSYQFSSRFIIGQESDKHNSPGTGILSFAPFASEGFALDSATYLDKLPKSKDEIVGLAGLQFVDSEATKQHFLQEINKFPLVHLATHAICNINNSSESYIAFYPQKKSVSEDCLFLEELYGLSMDSTQLVIISACETGQGELVNNEGVISLSRAFIYAGCASTVNSLWKANDESTSAILKKFHYYLNQGYSKSKALRQAKLDYIRSNALHKSPDYWSNLVLMGNIGPLYPSEKYYHWAIFFAISCGGIVLVRKLKKDKDKKSRRFLRT